MKNTKRKSSWFDSVLSDAVNDFAREMGHKPASKNQSSLGEMDNANHSPGNKTSVKSKKNAERICEI